MADDGDDPDDGAGGGAVDPDEISDDDLDRMAAAALAAVADQRQRTHDAAQLALAALLATLAGKLDHAALLAAWDPDKTRSANRAAVAAELATQVAAFGMTQQWVDVLTAAHTQAVLAGTAAAVHVLTAGAVPVDPGTSPFPDPFHPAEWMREQQGALAGDLVDALNRADAPAADDLYSVVAAGTGALVTLDVQVSTTYLDASAAIYGAVGLDQLWWNCMGGACPICLAIEANNPYTSSSLPMEPHPFCRCWISPGAPG